MSWCLNNTKQLRKKKVLAKDTYSYKFAFCVIIQTKSKQTDLMPGWQFCG